MSKEVAFKNIDRYIQLSDAISSLRKQNRLSQYALAEGADISRSLLRKIEAPGVIKTFSIEVFYNISDILKIPPEDLMAISNINYK